MRLCKEIELNERKLRCYSCGKVETFTYNIWRKIATNPYTKRNGYISYRITINQKHYSVSRVIAHAFLGLDINNPQQVVDHIDRNPLNNCITNLRIVTHQQNMFNTNAKGYHWYKRDKKWRARICVNYKDIYIGQFDTEDEARTAYIQAKEKYHILPNSSPIVDF